MIIIKLVIAIVLVAFFIIGTQDLQLFPVVVEGFFVRSLSDSSFIPKNVKSVFLKTKDNKNIELWEYGPESELQVVLFHGNGGDNRQFFEYQTWLAEKGYKSYLFDYHGFGRSNGWPSEKKLYFDTEAVWEYLNKKGLKSKDTILFAISLGSGPAAYLASKIDPKAVIFLSPYISIPEIAGDKLLTKAFKRFVWHEFPVREYLESLDSTSIHLFHGERDTLILPRHSRELFESLKEKEVSLVIKEEASHNDLFNLSKKELAEYLIILVNNCYFTRIIFNKVILTSYDKKNSYYS